MVKWLRSINTLERRAHGEVDAIDTPIGYLPKYEDLKQLFKSKIDKDYPEDLYEKQFSLYIDNIIARIDLQVEAYGKEKNIPQKLFDIYKEQRQELVALKDKYGAIVTPKQLTGGECLKKPKSGKPQDRESCLPSG